jgi:hypothetical protein
MTHLPPAEEFLYCMIEIALFFSVRVDSVVIELVIADLLPLYV